jgi:hypothetical protein
MLDPQGLVADQSNVLSARLSPAEALAEKARKKSESQALNDFRVTGVGPKYDTGKPRFSLLPKGVVYEVVRVLEFGATKYHVESWKQVPNGRQRYYDAMMRHIEYWWGGETYDKETGIHHLAHATCNAFFLIWKDFNEPQAQSEAPTGGVREISTD